MVPLGRNLPNAFNVTTCTDSNYSFIIITESFHLPSPLKAVPG